MSKINAVVFFITSMCACSCFCLLFTISDIAVRSYLLRIRFGIHSGAF